MDRRGEIKELEISVMARIVFRGWRVGMKKVAFTKLLHNQAGLPLKQAQNITLRVLDEEPIEIDISDIVIAKSVVIEADKLGVNTELIE
jgi:hypothetical protein